MKNDGFEINFGKIHLQVHERCPKKLFWKKKFFSWKKLILKIFENFGKKFGVKFVENFLENFQRNFEFFFLEMIFEEKKFWKIFENFFVVSQPCVRYLCEVSALDLLFRWRMRIANLGNRWFLSHNTWFHDTIFFLGWHGTTWHTRSPT